MDNGTRVSTGHIRLIKNCHPYDSNGYHGASLQCKVYTMSFTPAYLCAALPVNCAGLA